MTLYGGYLETAAAAAAVIIILITTIIVIIIFIIIIIIIIIMRDPYIFPMRMTLYGGIIHYQVGT